MITPEKQKLPHQQRSLIWDLIDKGVAHFRKFSEMTSLHGMRYLGEKHMSLLERLFWAGVMLSTYTCCAYFVLQVTVDFNASPVLMSVDTRATPSWSIPSPAVTVCSTSHISHSSFDFESICAQTNLSETMKLRLDVVREFCGAAENQSREFLDTDAIKYVTKNYLPDMDRVFISIIRMREEINISQSVQKILTPVSVCFVHNMLPLPALLRPEYLNVYQEYGLLDDTEGEGTARSVWTPDQGYIPGEDPNLPPLRLWGSGIRSSAKYLLSVSDIDYDPLCSFGSKGLSVYLHNPAEMPWRVHSNVFLQMDFRVAAFITPHITSTDDVLKEWSPMKRGCYFESERYLRYYKLYTQRNCERECDSNNTLKYCGCVRLSHPRNINMPICGPKKQACVERTQREMMERELMTGMGEGYCGCLPTCNDIDFEIEKHWRPWNFDVNTSYATVPASVDRNTTSISLISIGAKKKYVNKLKRTAVMGFYSYVANIGGVMSLYTGCSVVSLYEVAYFLTLRILTNIWNIERKKRQQTAVVPSTHDGVTKLAFVH